MPYEKVGEPIPVSTVGKNANTYQPSMRTDEYVVDHQAARRPTKKVEPVETKSGQTGITVSASEETKIDATKTEESVSLSPAAAALARKEQAFRRQQQELKAKEQALEAERQEIAELKALKSKLANKDYSDLEKLAPYDEYTNYLIEKSSSTTPEQEEIKKLRSEIEEVRDSHKKEIDQRFEAAVNERRKAVTSLVDSDPAYSSIKELKLQEAVVQHILDTWEHDSVDLPIEQAAKEVEELLNERAAKFASLSKFKSQQKPVEEKKELPPLKPGIKTLTNNMAATGEIKRPQRSFADMKSDSERYAEAKRRVLEKSK